MLGDRGSGDRPPFGKHVDRRGAMQARPPQRTGHGVGPGLLRARLRQVRCGGARLCPAACASRRRTPPARCAQPYRPNRRTATGAARPAAQRGPCGGPRPETVPAVQRDPDASGAVAGARGERRPAAGRNTDAARRTPPRGAAWHSGRTPSAGRPRRSDRPHGRCPPVAAPAGRQRRGGGGAGIRRTSLPRPVTGRAARMPAMRACRRMVNGW